MMNIGLHNLSVPMQTEWKNLYVALSYILERPIRKGESSKCFKT